MKIENYSLSLRSEYATTVTQSVQFETQLQNLAVEKETRRRDLAEQEREIIARLQYELLSRLLQIFCGCRGRDQAEARGFVIDDTPAQARQTASVRVVERRFESQSFEVNMGGCIQTSNRSIAIDVRLSMSKSFVQEREISETLFYDPLVLNFDGEIPELETTTFAFDIDNDGSADQVSRLREGNGFLALDRNGNGCIDAGCELFGTESGNGFVDLSAYDSDGNDWIDESDPVFEKLRIWTPGAGGRELVALGEAGIGAIYLGSAYTPMDYKSAENEALGRLKATGLYLYENGRSGVVGEVDLARRKQEEAPGLAQALSDLSATA